MTDILRNILVKIDWIQKIRVTVKEERIKFNTLKGEILKWLKNLKKVFSTISEEKLLFSRKEIDYEIKLRTKEIKSLLLISIRLKKQQIIKKYLNKMLKKIKLKLIRYF